MAKSVKTRIYDPKGVPCVGFNKIIKSWLEGSVDVREHQKPAALTGLRSGYDQAVTIALKSGLTKKDSHKLALSQLTDLLFGHDLAKELGLRLNPSLINETGFRTTLSQGVAKNVGENFVNIIVYAIADLLEDNDDVLVDKGLPPSLKRALTLNRVVPLKTGDQEIRINIEGDMAIFSRSNPFDAIVVSAKTRLKEVFHIGTMWKMLFDTLSDEHALHKWGLKRNGTEPLEDVLYTFATADMVKSGGRKSQGPDVERAQPRNLIAMDASFFDYVFVSKSGIAHVANTIELNHRGALFHELGCLIDLIDKKFELGMT